MWASNVLWHADCNEAQTLQCKSAPAIVFGTQALPYIDFIQHSETQIRVGVDACGARAVSGPIGAVCQELKGPDASAWLGEGLSQCLCIQVGKHWLESLCQSWRIAAVWGTMTMQRWTWDLVSIRGYLSSKQESTPTNGCQNGGEHSFALQEGNV